MKKLHHFVEFELAAATPPYSLELTVRKPLGYHWLTPTQVFSDGTLWTAIGLLSRRPVGLRLKTTGNVKRPNFLVTAFSDEILTNEEEREVLNTVTRCAELRVDISEFYSMAEYDPVVRQIKMDLYGMRCGQHQRLLHGLVRAITMQNAPLGRTKQMIDLLFCAYGRKLAFDEHTVVAWFTPEQIARAGVGELKEKCKLGFRAGYIKAVAESIQSKKCPTIEELGKMPFESAKTELMRLKGVGEYSAEIALPHPERFPIDVWSAKVFWKLFFPREPIPPMKYAIKRVRKLAEERWRKWRGCAFVYSHQPIYHAVP